MRRFLAAALMAVTLIPGTCGYLEPRPNGDVIVYFKEDGYGHYYKVGEEEAPQPERIVFCPKFGDCFGTLHAEPIGHQTAEQPK